MALEAGTKLGLYEILSPLGAGGMGEVYLANDPKLDRKVAIKVLPESMTRNKERVARFEREAKLLASLNHPNIAAIFGFDDSDGTRFLVMEYVEGETLAGRLKSGALAVEDALNVAKRMAEALEAAHEKGVIHRDLKPGNVMIRPDGSVKVLDFGLAKAMVDDSSTSLPADSPTITANYTKPGVILGTAAYMSPEQARGRAVDKRTDIWSFGVVLYEMLTGVGPFRGESATDSVGAVLHKAVDFDGLPPGSPAVVRRVLNRCLARDRAKRYRDIGDVLLDLEAAFDSRDADHTPILVHSRWKQHVLIGCLGLLLGVGLAAISIIALRDSSDRPIRTGARRYSIQLPQDAPLAPAGAMPFGAGRPKFDVSRDGRLLVYVALIDGETHLYLMDLTTGSTEPLRGTAGGFGPFFSPDGRQIGFFAREKLYKILPGLDGNPEVMADATSPVGAFWAPDGNIYFAPTEGDAVVKLSAAGGRPTPVTKSQMHGYLHAWPHLLPDGETLLFTISHPTPAIGAVDTGDMASQRILSKFGSDGRYLPTGHLVFVRGDRLAAVGFDVERVATSGSPATVITGLQSTFLRGQFALSDDGTLIYAEGSDDGLGRFVWVDRKGSRRPLGLGQRRFVSFRLSPDSKKLGVPINDGNDQDIWIFDLARLETPTRITFGGYHNHVVWTDDSRHLIYRRELDDGSSALRAKDLLFGGDDYEILRSSAGLLPLGHDAKRRELLFSEGSADGMSDLKVGVIDLNRASGGKVEDVRTLRGTPYNEVFAAYSPDKNWIVFNSDETGRWELYLAAYTTPEKRIQISTGGGEEPIWTADGTRLIYRWGSSWFEVEASLETEPTVTAPKLVTTGPYINVPGYSWDMTPDGELLLLIEGPDQDRTITELKVVTNFFEEIMQRCPKDD